MNEKLTLCVFRRLDELEKTLASMRKSLETQNPPPAGVGVANSTEAGFGSSFGHPLDMLARTAANSHSPDDRFTPGATNFNGITPPTHPSTIPRPPPRIGTTSDIVTSWSTELSGIDPVERGWLDLNETKSLFERFLVDLDEFADSLDFGNICFRQCLS